MAKELEKTFSVNLGQVVRESITAIQAVRRSESAKKEADFQAAVSAGMSYQAQVEYREQQLAEASTSAFGVDEGYVADLKDSIGSLKKLKRFNDYRSKYAEALGDMNEGKINAKVYRDRLQSMFDTATDPELRLEIQGNLSQADTEVKRYEDTILSNQIKRAEFDGTEKVLKGVIRKVKDARAKASLNGTEDEVTAYDATLSSLNSQLTTARIEDAVNDMTVASATRGINASGKLKTLNDEISRADEDSPITINGKRYDSAQEYWTSTRDLYLAGQGSGLFGDYFGELDNEYSQKINGDVARYGYTPATTIQSINQDFANMVVKPEFAPFLDRVKNMQSVAVAAAVNTMAKTVIDRAVYTGDYKTADATLQRLGQQFGVDTQNFRLDLGNKLNVAVNASIDATGEVPAEASLLPETDFPVPTTDTKPTPGGVPEVPATPSGAQGQNLEYITDQTTGRTFFKDLNNPQDTYKEFFGSPPAGSAVTPPATETTVVTPTPQKPQTPTPSKPNAPVVSTPAPVVTPKPAATAVGYAGGSIRDFLASKGEDSSVTARAKLAFKEGLVKTEKEYLDLAATGSNADINTSLLKKMRGY